MADMKISQLTQKNTLTANDIITILDSSASNTNKKALVSAIKDYVFTTLTVDAPLGKDGDTILITQASDASDGYLTSDDFNAFNDKQNIQFVDTTTASPLTIQPNTCYKLGTITELTISNYLVHAEEVEIQFTCGETFAFTATGYVDKWVNAIPTFEAGRSYVIAIKNGLASWGAIVSSSASGSTGGTIDDSAMEDLEKPERQG